jgi:hypothetical protein
LQSQISDTLIKAIMDTSKPLTTHYGAIMGISKLGPHVSTILLIPVLKTYMNILLSIAATNASNNKIRYNEALKCIELLTNVYAECIYHYLKTLITDLNSWNQKDIHDYLNRSDTLKEDLQTSDLLLLFDQNKIENNVKRFIDTNSIK